jgi:hypothetical protein
MIFKYTVNNARIILNQLIFLFNILMTNCFTITASSNLLVAINRVSAASVALSIITNPSVFRNALFCSMK